VLRAIGEIVLTVLLGVALFTGIDGVTVRSNIEGPSMEPTLHAGQVVLLSRLGISGVTGVAYAATHTDSESADASWVPERGSICTFIKPEGPRMVLVKRLIGLPGEEVAIVDGVVYINGQPLDEPYVVNHDHSSMPATRIPSNQVFMLGDNRPKSSDSRLFGPVPRGNLLGVAVLRYWPLHDITLFSAQ
jgi:signal peptidase I